MRRYPLTLLLSLALGLLLAGCADGVVDAGSLQDMDADEEASTDTDATNGTQEADEAETQQTGPTGGTDEADRADEEDRHTDEAPARQGDESASDAGDGASSAEDEGDDGDADTTLVRLYYLAPGGGTPARADPFLVSLQREIPSTPGIALATLRELVDGPTHADEEMIDGISTVVPPETLVLGVAIDEGLATVNLSREFESGGGSLSMLGRLAQIVYTITQFPTVDEVEFQLDGEKVTVFSGEGIVIDGPGSRDDFRHLLPTVFVDTPAAGADVTDPLRVTGMAMVFEATFQYRLEAADGTVLAEGHTMTDNGMGWGAFDFTIPFEVAEQQKGTLTVWEYSAKDGSVQGERSTPVVLNP